MRMKSCFMTQENGASFFIMVIKPVKHARTPARAITAGRNMEMYLLAVPSHESHGRLPMMPSAPSTQLSTLPLYSLIFAVTFWEVLLLSVGSATTSPFALFSFMLLCSFCVNARQQLLLRQ